MTNQSNTIIIDSKIAILQNLISDDVTNVNDAENLVLNNSENVNNNTNND